MPDVRNCRKCGKIFNYLVGVPICPVCKQADEEDFHRIKDYLYKHPGASMTEVSTELEVGVDQIKRYLREGRLEITSDEANLILQCEKCGKSIKSGRLCEACERELAAGLQSTANRMKNEMHNMPDTSRKSVGMRYLNKDDGKKG